MQVELRHLSKPSYLQIFLYLVAGLLLWGITFFSGNTLNSQHNAILLNITTIAITLINAVLLSQLLNLFSFVNTKSFTGVIVFFLLITTWEETHLLYTNHIALLLFILMYFQFLIMPHDEKPAEKAFLGSIFLGIASLLVKDVVFLLPFCWIGFLILYVLSFRTFIASLLGFIVPHILFIASNYIFSFIPDIQEFYNYSFEISLSVPDFSLIRWIYIGLISAVLLIIIVSTYSEFNKKSIHTRRNLNFTLILLIFFILVMIIYPADGLTFLPVFAFLYSVLFAHTLATKKSNFYSILFIIFCVTNIAYIFYNAFF